MSKTVDMAKSEAMHDWWYIAKRRNPDKVPTPAEAFGAGFDAARAIYKAHAEEAIKALNALQPDEPTNSTPEAS